MGTVCVPVASHNSVMTLNIGVALGQFAEPGSPGPQFHRQWRCLPNVDRRGRNVYTPSPTGACSQSGHRDRSHHSMHDADRLWNARTTRMNKIRANAQLVDGAAGWASSLQGGADAADKSTDRTFTQG